MIKKKLSPAGNVVRVTFELPAEMAEEGAAVVGDFNDWDAESGQMDYIKTRDVWKKGFSLEPGASYQFRYLVDGTTWCNDEEADDYVPNEYSSENGVVDLPAEKAN
jgi:1,4-alpha-glucan branching enzyme